MECRGRETEQPLFIDESSGVCSFVSAEDRLSRGVAGNMLSDHHSSG